MLTSSPSRILWIDSWMSASWQISDSAEDDDYYHDGYDDYDNDDDYDD